VNDAIDELAVAGCHVYAIATSRSQCGIVDPVRLAVRDLKVPEYLVFAPTHPIPIEAAHRRVAMPFPVTAGS